jgi:hypothetical protein
MSDFGEGIQSGYLGPEEARKLIEDADRIKRGSWFSFLRNHNGLRPGKVHLLIGCAGAGKSTLVRAMILESLYFCQLAQTQTDENLAVFLILSEEERDEFLTELYRCSPKKPETFKFLKIISEQESNVSDPIGKLAEAASVYTPYVVYYDNITTSKTYENRRPEEQFGTATMLKTYAKAFQVPLVLVAHTRSEISENITRLISAEDIRGNKSIVNLAEFAYVLQRFHTPGAIFPTLRIVKHRGQDPSEKMFYLEFNKERRIISGDKSIPFHEFKENFKNRYRLGD